MRRGLLRWTAVAVVTLAGPLSAYLPMQLVDTPTTETLPKATYHVYFCSYEAGGIKAKVAIGLSDRLTLGISEDVGGAIGDGRVQWNIPGVLAKVNILRPAAAERGWGWSVGYDNFVEGEYGKTQVTTKNARGEDVLRTEVVYGVYSVWNRTFRLFGPGQSVSFGARYPLLPWNMPKDLSDLTFFAGLDVPFNRELRFVTELEGLNLDFTDYRGVLMNFGLRYVAGDVLGVSLNFRYAPDRGRLSRIVVIEYQNLFF